MCFCHPNSASRLAGMGGSRFSTSLTTLNRRVTAASSSSESSNRYLPLSLSHRRISTRCQMEGLPSWMGAGKLGVLSISLRMFWRLKLRISAISVSPIRSGVASTSFAAGIARLTSLMALATASIADEASRVKSRAIRPVLPMSARASSQPDSASFSTKPSGSVSPAPRLNFKTKSYSRITCLPISLSASQAVVDHLSDLAGMIPRIGRGAPDACNLNSPHWMGNTFCPRMGAANLYPPALAFRILKGLFHLRFRMLLPGHAAFPCM